MEKIKPQESVPIYDLDISESWDTDSQVEMFLDGLKRLGIYREGLLYSGFDADSIGTQTLSNTAKDVVYCSTEEELTDETHQDENAMKYALYYKNPAMSIYDETKMKMGNSLYDYKIIDSSALIALIKLRLDKKKIEEEED